MSRIGSDPSRPPAGKTSAAETNEKETGNMSEDCVTLSRNTKETKITVSLDRNGCGKHRIETGIGFFDHMLTAFSVHSGIDMDISVSGDLDVDCHHTIEDTGIVLGKAFAQMLGDKSGIVRYGSALIPMDEALAQVVVDVSGRPFLVFDAEFSHDMIGAMDTQMVEEFFRAFAFNAGITLHARLISGSNDHHKAEALFKALAHAVEEAIRQKDGNAMLSTKGSFD